MLCFRKILILYFYTLLLITKVTFIKTWNLNSLNLITNYTIRHVSVYYMRAFLSIESTNDEQIPTLIEATWPENIIPMQPRIFPSIHAHAVSKATKQCSKIHRTACTDVDRRGKLWVIDNGTKYCPPKLVVYTILPWNEKVVMEHITSLKANTISSIICDPLNSENGSTRAYISLYDKDYIMIYSLKTKKWWKLTFRDDNIITNNNSFLSERIQLKPSELALGERNTILYLSNYKTGELYSMNLTKIRNYNERKKMTKVPIKYLGVLLGRPKGMITDQAGNLYYIIPRDGAIVRWNPRKALKAEKHDILFQISANITQILFGIKGSIWIVTSTPGEFIEADSNDHCIRILLHYTSLPQLRVSFDSNESDYY